LNPTIVALPGLAADARLFERQRAAFPDLIVPEWPRPAPDDSLRAFAARLAPMLPPREPLLLAGASFGGMVALELSHSVPAQAVLLIGSARAPSAIAPVLRCLGPLTRVLPRGTYRQRAWWRPAMRMVFGSLTRSHQELFWAMLGQASPSFLQWGVRAILSWKPSTVSVLVHHIHGARDRLIPLGRVAPDRIVPNGGHLLSLTHPDEGNDLVLAVRRLVAST
jgi:pimeloyl-ACP methyl ester carboxylesterase